MPQAKFLKPNKKSVIYEDEKLYVCLAKEPITKGHIVIVWKDNVADLHFLCDRDYDYLMDTVSTARDALLKTLKIKKVYLIYMDEAKHVHWHLVPRYEQKGYDVFSQKLKAKTDLSLVPKIKKNLVFQ